MNSRSSDKFFLAGFECSSHKRRDGARVDVIAKTQHDRHAKQDYDLVARHGLRWVRDGLRWHLIEREVGRYDWSSWRPMLEAARDAGVEVIWDIWHYGTPEFIDIWSPDFIERLVAFATAAARMLQEETDAVPSWCPVNEMSFYSFIAGEVGDFYPYASGRGFELKRQLARAAIAVSEALLAVDPRARLLWAEPAVDVHPKSFEHGDVEEARNFHFAQYQALDMVCGRMEPELGGGPHLLDIVGVNYYPNNQWVLGGSAVAFGHHAFRPFADILDDVYQRYRRPIIVAETGAEGSARAPWFHYVCQEVETAMAAGIPVQGICLYPVLNYPGWDDDRHCATGLLGPAQEDGTREVYTPLLHEMERQRRRFEKVNSPASSSARPNS